MKDLSIKIKLIVIFILIKVIPLILIMYIAYVGVLKLDHYIDNNTKYMFNENKQIILNTANESINDSIKNLDKKSQLSIERLSYEIASKVAEFLYQRDEDILFLSKLTPNQKIYQEFYNSKNRNIIIHDDYYYDDKTNTWKTNEQTTKITRENKQATLKDNEKEFNYTDPIKFKTKNIPIYKEVVYFDLKGKERYKVSQISNKLLNISNKQNTYINSESYFEKIKTLKKGEIYVSNVIGEYVGSNVIGRFTKQKTDKLNIEFNPNIHGYAGKENPNGKKFEGIVRFITPVYKNGKKTGFLSLALDHEHIMQFTDTVNPTSSDVKQNIADASIGNYAFMWDNKGRNISHARDYFITGYDKTTGKEAMPWLSLDVAKKFNSSNKNINEFLENYPTFEEQSLSKKPNIAQVIKDGNLGLDCRYLNFAPQCEGWMQVTKNGGYGSFIIYWSKVWKLTTAATIPYYTGDYGKTKRGFGFVTIGANVDEFHAAANQTKENVSKILNEQTENMSKVVNTNKDKIEEFIASLINELTIITFIMIILVIAIALWLSNYISNKIENLLIGTKKFSNNELEYRINITSNDEIGKLEKSFNEMAVKINKLIKEEQDLNETLELRVKEEIDKRVAQEQILIQQSRLAAMGEMIGNIAHQWRQPLNVLALSIQNIHFSYNMNKLTKENLDIHVKKSNKVIQNMSRTIDDFRNFFKPNKEVKVFTINEALESSLDIIGSTLEHHEIKINKNINDNIKIKGFPNEYSQVILNILSNAKDALENSNNELKEINIEVFSDNINNFITIEDNAGGIPDNAINKIFEPYFSTKEEGKGTGIGLYMSKTIIETNMDGKLIVSNTSKGAKFTISTKVYKEEE